MDVFRAAGIAVVTAVLAVTVRQTRPELSLEIAIAGGIVLLGLAAAEFGAIAVRLREIFGNMGVSESLGTVLRIAGIACTAQIASDICRDSGENALASNVELAGKLIMLSAALPMLARLAGIIVDLAEEFL